MLLDEVAATLGRGTFRLGAPARARSFVSRPILQVPVGFSTPVVDKVERLLEALFALRDNPVLADAFVLHRGTAL